MLGLYVTLHMLLSEKRADLQLRRDDKGATAVEYGMMVALIAAVIVVVVAALGGKINTAFTTINNKLT